MRTVKTRIFKVEMTPMERAVWIAGNRNEMARLCGVTAYAVSKWLKLGVSAERAVQIEKVLKDNPRGHIDRSILRPDLWPWP